VNSRFLPWVSAALMSAAVLFGLATKNWSIGIDDPAGAPFAQVVPWLFVRSAGTNTW
jgi:hypothetical protein